MTWPWYGVVGDRYDRHGHAYMEVGTFETQNYAAAMATAIRYASLHPNAAACILLDGSPHMWVFHKYDLGKNEETIILKGCGDAHSETRVNGKIVYSSRPRLQ